MKNSCPICSGILVRHLCPRQVRWFCLSCHQEVPNFNLAEFNGVKEKLVQFNSNRTQHKDAALKRETPNNTSTAEYRSIVIDLLLDRDCKRLKVVNFILNKIDIISVNTLADTEKKNINNNFQSDRLENDNIQTATSVKANFLRDSEIILLCICQAILFADNAILSNSSLKKLKANTVNFKFTVEQSLFIDLIKTLVVSFIYSIAIDSDRSVDCFALEVASYFEMAIDYLSNNRIELGL